MGEDKVSFAINITLKLNLAAIKRIIAVKYQMGQRSIASTHLSTSCLPLPKVVRYLMPATWQAERLRPGNERDNVDT